MAQLGIPPMMEPDDGILSPLQQQPGQRAPSVMMEPDEGILFQQQTDKLLSNLRTGTGHQY